MRTPRRLISLDHFRSRVYRPRLALVILLVLLSGCVTPPSTTGRREDGVAVNGSTTMTMTTTTSAGQSDTGRSAFVGNNEAWSGGAGDATSKAVITEDKPASNTAKTTTTRMPTKLRWSPGVLFNWFTSSDADTPSKPHAQTPRTPRTRLAISLFLSPAIFPTLVQLHLLWLVRFVSGEIEGRTSASHGSGRQAPYRASNGVLSVMFVLVLTTASILHPWTTSALQRIATRAVAGSETFSDPSTLFPCMWILIIEAVPTLLSLVSLLNGFLLPSQFSVPSPSHLPSVLELLPFWLRAPFTPSEQERARRSALLAGRTRRHGAFGGRLPPTPTAAMLRLDEEMSSGNTSEAGEGGGGVHARAATESTSTSTPTPTTTTTPTPTSISSPAHSRTESHSEDSHSHAHSQGTPAWTALSPGDGPRVLRLQQAMVAELERAGRLPTATAARLDGKSSNLLHHQRHQRVNLPASYFLSVVLSMTSSTSLIVCYSLITLKLPNLAPTSVPAIVSLLALRAEIGGLVKYWNEERRRVEGLEFVRRRWGVASDEHAMHSSHTSTCSICFEAIHWSNEQEDGVRLDCQHELHAPCLVPWLMSQSFCPVCHRPLRPSGVMGGGGSTPGHSRSASGSASLRSRRRHHHHHHHHHRRRSRSGGEETSATSATTATTAPVPDSH